MLTWANQWPQRRWAIENAEGLGRHLTSWLVARGEDVVDVPTTATARVRQLSRGGGRKNDRIDAAAAACVAALQGDARPMEAEGPADAIAVLDERRGQPGSVQGPRGQSTPRAASRPYRWRRPSGSVCRRRKCPVAHGPTLWCGGARPQGRRQRPGGRDPSRSTSSCGPIPALSPSSSLPPAALLTQTVGVGPIMAGRLISRTGHASRFPTSAAFANYAGAAPVEIASADQSRHRLSRQRRPPTQLRPPHHRHHPDPHAQQRRPRLLQHQDRRRKDPTRSRCDA